MYTYNTWLVEFTPEIIRVNKLTRSWTTVTGTTWLSACMSNTDVNPSLGTIRRVYMLPRKNTPLRGSKLTQWMVDNIKMCYPQGVLRVTGIMPSLVASERAYMAEVVASVHSSAIHARINARTPGSMLAARHAGYVG